METLTIRLEIDVMPSDRARLAAGYEWVGMGEFDGVYVRVAPTQGHGFGLTEVMDATVVFGGGVAAGVTANLLTEALKIAVRGTVRRAQAHKGLVDLPIPEEDEDFEIEATSVNESVRIALNDLEGSG